MVGVAGVAGVAGDAGVACSGSPRGSRWGSDLNPQPTCRDEIGPSQADVYKHPTSHEEDDVMDEISSCIQCSPSSPLWVSECVQLSVSAGCQCPVESAG